MESIFSIVMLRIPKNCHMLDYRKACASTNGELGVHYLSRFLEGGVHFFYQCSCPYLPTA